MKRFNFVLFSCALSSSLAFANHNLSEDILCPQITSVQKASASLDALIYYEGLTYVWTSNPAFDENGYAWRVATTVDITQEADEALGNARTQIQQIGSLEDPVAQKLSFYVCYYGPYDVIAYTSGHFGFESGLIPAFRQLAR